MNFHLPKFLGHNLPSNDYSKAQLLLSPPASAADSSTSTQRPAGAPVRPLRPLGQALPALSEFNFAGANPSCHIYSTLSLYNRANSIFQSVNVSKIISSSTLIAVNPSVSRRVVLNSA